MIFIIWIVKKQVSLIFIEFIDPNLTEEIHQVQEDNARSVLLEVLKDKTTAEHQVRDSVFSIFTALNKERPLGTALKFVRSKNKNKEELESKRLYFLCRTNPCLIFRMKNRTMKKNFGD